MESGKGIGELIDFTLNIARYLIANGNVIKDGDTIGDLHNKNVFEEYIS